MINISHHTIREAILGRIHAGEWELGGLIPAEMVLAEEYGCARTTVNRALRALADDGLLVRKRKGGTRLCKMPIRHAKFEIQIVREQVEESGGIYGYKLLKLDIKKPPEIIRQRLHLADKDEAMYIETLHLSNARPFAFETRWVNINSVPTILEAPLETMSVNEWLVKTVPFSSGDVIFSAVSAPKDIASAMEAVAGSALFIIDLSLIHI